MKINFFSAKKQVDQGKAEKRGR
jgi:hypothetical protein